MAARAVITMSPEQYLAGLKQIESETGKSTSKMQNSFQSYGKDIGKAGGALRSFGQSIGSEFGNAGKIIGSLASPIAAITAAIGGFAAFCAGLFDQLTLSANEYIAKLDHTLSAEQKRFAKMQAAQKEEQTYIDRLKELSTEETLSNDQKTEAISLLETLSSRYETFDAKLDSTTGKIIGLAEAEKKLNEEQKKNLKDSLERQLKTLNAKNAKEIEVGFGFFSSNTLEGKDAAAAFNRLPIDRRIEYAQNIYDNRAKTDKEIEGLGKIIDRLNQIKDIEDQLNNLNRIGELTDAEKAANLEKESKRKAKEEADALKKLEAQAALEYRMQQQQEEADKKHTAALVEQLNKAEQTAKANRESYEKYIKGTANRLNDSALRLQGRSKEADVESAVRSAREAAGGYLTKDQESQVRKLALMEHKLSTISISAPELYAPRVNSLIARGGSAAPVKMPKVEEYQAKTLSAVDKMAKDTGFIRNYLQDNGLI